MMIIAHFGFGAMRGSYANGQQREGVIHISMRLLQTKGERHRAKGRKASQLPGNDGVGAKTKEPRSLKRVSSRELVCPRLRSVMV